MATTEREIFDRLTSSFKAAAECCDKLASEPRTGANYVRLRRHLQYIEGAARQAAHWREDSRWLKVGLDAAHCHQKAGDWLRSHAARRNFTALAATMRKLHAAAERLRIQPTGHVGAILVPPQARPSPRTIHPVGWTPSKSGLLIPQAGVVA